MAEMESDVIEHLIELETHASTVMQDAREEALKKINSAKALAEKDYLKKFSLVSEDMEKAFLEESKKLKAKTSIEIESYKTEILNSKQDTAAFNSLMDSLVVQ